MKIDALYCPECGNKIGVERDDGVIVVRWKARTIEFTGTGVITCEECGGRKEVDSRATIGAR